MTAINARLVIEARFLGRNGQAELTVRLGDEVLHHDVVRLGRVKDRELFISDLVRGRPGLEAEAVRRELAKLAADRARANDRGNADSSSVADLLLDLAGEAVLFHNANNVAYATIQVGEHFEHWPVRSKTFRLWLRRRLREEHGRPAYSDAIQMAIEEVESKAIFEGEQVEVYVRLAEADGVIYLDLADDAWRAVKVTSAGWSIDNTPPVRFIRPRGMLPLPAPVAGGAISDLRWFLNVKEDSDFVLMVVWLLAALNPRGPYPILNTCGEQDSGKSFGHRLLRALVDPNVAPLRSTPRTEDDLIISASNSWVQAFDNLSNIPPWLSDAFCRLSTGGGLGKRQLFSDSDEVLFDVKRPLVFNSIEGVASRPDLLDRCITILLPPISAANHRDERGLWANFELARPRILGALLNGVAAGLAHRDAVAIPADQKPRMLDFALWATACEPGLGWEPGTFIAAYAGNRASANAVAIEASVVARAVQSFMKQHPDGWQGTATELLAALEAEADERTCKGKDWPRSARKLSGDLRRIAPNLRRDGIEVTMDRRIGKSRDRLIVLERIQPDGPGGGNSDTVHQPSAPAFRPSLWHHRACMTWRTVRTVGTVCGLLFRKP